MLNSTLIFLFLALNGLWKSGQKTHLARFSTDSTAATAFFALFFLFLTTALIGSHGGILAPGAGKIKNGENGKGLSSRWYPETLAKRIRNIIKIRERITFIEGDGVEELRRKLSDIDVAWFIDPPYTAGGKSAGSRLYTHSDLDHNELFTLCSKLSGDFLMTYSNDKATKILANKNEFVLQEIAMKNTHHAKMTELLVGRNLDWLR